jgi:uncharacterized protein (TIGR00251 family)
VQTHFRLQIRLQPRAARNRIVGRHGDALKVQVHAPPVDGAANAALVELLAETFDVPRRAVRILQGSASRNKVVEIDCADAAACRRRLDTLLAARVDKAGGRG